MNANETPSPLNGEGRIGESRPVGWQSASGEMRSCSRDYQRGAYRSGSGDDSEKRRAECKMPPCKFPWGGKSHLLFPTVSDLQVGVNTKMLDKII